MLRRLIDVEGRELTMRFVQSMCVLACLTPGVALGGPEWGEGGQDAGNLPTDAQPARGNGSLERISGELSTVLRPGRGTADFQDMYLIGIRDPENFTATTLNSQGGFAQFDAQLFLFFADGQGLLASLDAPGFEDPLILPQANDDTQASIPYKGRFLLAISGRGSLPRSQSGDSPIFRFDSQVEVSGPDGLGGMFPIDAWTTPGLRGQYLIALNGAVLLPFGCNMADLAPPFGTLDFSDVLAFLTAFASGDLISVDLAPPYGTLDFSDVLRFLQFFDEGCPGG